MTTPRVPAQVAATPSFNFMAGVYRLSKWTIPYFTTTMTLKQAASSLKLVNEFPGVERLSWRLEELFQRDVDWVRVERSILPYLRSESQPQFFNGLTVALLPIRNKEIAPDYTGTDWHPPAAEDSGLPMAVQVAGVRFSYYQKWSDPLSGEAKLGQIRWNLEEMFSVAIDGQHRLAAIKKLVAQDELSDRVRVSSVPIVLLILDERIGFHPGDNMPLLETIRRIFVDLNKHAVTVDRTRQILLDDKDPHSVCVRGLVGNRLGEGLDLLSEAPPRLPLSLVDWHRHEAKVDRGPYLHTILGLDFAVTKILGVKPISDFLDTDEIRDQLDAIERQLGVRLEKAHDRLDQLAELGNRPFAYLEGSQASENEPLRISTAFRRVWAGPVVALFSQLPPYLGLIDLRKANHSFQPEFLNWYYLFNRMEKDKYEGEATNEYKKLVAHLENRADSPIAESVLKERLKEIEQYKQSNLAFNVVFQRALIQAFVAFERWAPDERLSTMDSLDDVFGADRQDDVESPSAAAIKERAARVGLTLKPFMNALGSLCMHKKWLTHQFVFKDRNDVEVPFWSGTFLSSKNGTIDFSLGASSRGSELLLLSPLIFLEIGELPARRRNDFEAWWEDLRDEDAELSPLKKVILAAIERYRKSAARKIVKERDDYEDLDNDDVEEEEWEQARARVEWLWSQMKKCVQSPPQ
jgi:hypothetical protein